MATARLAPGSLCGAGASSIACSSAFAAAEASVAAGALGGLYTVAGRVGGGRDGGEGDGGGGEGGGGGPCGGGLAGGSARLAASRLYTYTLPVPNAIGDDTARSISPSAVGSRVTAEPN